jgi:hypothetical protein
MHRRKHDEDVARGVTPNHVLRGPGRQPCVGSQEPEEPLPATTAEEFVSAVASAARQVIRQELATVEQIEWLRLVEWLRLSATCT